jgi:GNAT superfamily N-acetyltransferase
MNAAGPIVIREAQTSDAPGLIAFMRALVEEPDVWIALDSGEFRYSLEQEEEYIRAHRDKANSVLLVAEAGGAILGVLNVDGGGIAANRQTGVMGISVAAPWRGRGIGRRLMEGAIRWARQEGGLRRLELHVFEANGWAIDLYRKLGFVQEGRLLNRSYKHGRFQNEWIMALYL